MRKLVIGWLVAVAVGTVAVVSCSINHRSGAYACETNADCEDGRVCSDDLCVVPGGTKPPDAAIGDAAKPPDAPPDGRACPDVCTSCNTEKKECIINCGMNPDGCTDAVVCPAGWHCNVMCSVQNSCRQGVNCTNALSCNIACSGQGSCRMVACGPGKCDVNCTGQGACRGISCGQSCGCDVNCSNNAECSGVMCTEFQCRKTFGTGCTSQPFGCNTCQM